MTYLDTNSRTVNPTVSEKFQPAGRQTVYHGVFVGLVKKTSDVQKNGRLSVWIPDLGSPPDEENGWVTVSYCSPFAGATNIDTVDRNNFQSFEGTQTSYGMWMVPPDINNEVAVMFIGGNPAMGIWIGCLYNQYMNNMVPGSPVSVQNAQYPGRAIPVAEYNKWNERVTDPAQAQRPYHKTKFRGVGNQGLIRDSHRGLSTSGARRESPSQVYGILTPGPAIDENVDPSRIRRKGGSALIMDDKVGSEYTQLTTKSGAQIKLDETHGFVYIINRDGTAWVQLDQYGNIDIFSAGSISARAQKDFNIRADRNVNIEAGQNVFIKAAKDTVESEAEFTYNVNNVERTERRPSWQYVGEGLGEGGNLVTQANNNWHSTTKNNAFLSTELADINLYANQNIMATAATGGQEFNSKLGIKLTTDGSIDLLAADSVKVAATNGVSISSKNNVSLCSKEKLSLNGDSALALSSYTEIGVTGQTLFSDNVWMRNKLTVRKNIELGGTVVEVEDPPDLDVVMPSAPESPISAGFSPIAEVKPLLSKVNVLPNWLDEGKFVRESQSVKTTVTRFPTFEPCPEHENYRSANTDGAEVPVYPADNTYVGSGGAGNTETSQPASSGDPTSKNRDLMPESPSDDATTKDFNMSAFRCQLIIHEGYKDVSYKDSLGLLTGGIGHLLRSPDETSRYPLGSPIAKEQIEKWYSEDAMIAIRGAISLLGQQVWDNLSDIRKRACADLCYNLGKGKLAKFVGFLGAMRANDWNLAGEELRNSLWFRQVGQRGPKIIAMITKNIDPNGCDKK